MVGGPRLERFEIKPLNQNVELATIFKYIELVVIPAVFADESRPFRRKCGGQGSGDLVKVLTVEVQHVAGKKDRRIGVPQPAVKHESSTRSAQILEIASAAKERKASTRLFQASEIAMSGDVVALGSSSDVGGNFLVHGGCGRRPALAQGQHVLEGEVGKVIRHCVRAVDRRNDDHAQFVFRQEGQLSGETIDRPTVRDLAMPIEESERKAQTEVAAKLRAVRPVKSDAGKKCSLASSALCEQGAEKESEVADARVHGARRRFP